MLNFSDGVSRSFFFGAAGGAVAILTPQAQYQKLLVVGRVHHRLAADGCYVAVCG